MKISTVLLSLVAASLCPVALAKSPFDGSWSLNVGKSQLTGDTMTFQNAGNGALKYTDSTQSYVFKPDGSSFTTPIGDEEAYQKTSDNGYTHTIKRNGLLLSTETWKLSPDGDTVVIESQGTRPNGHTFDDYETFVRTSAGTGLVGGWKSTKIKATSPNTLTILTAGKDDVTLTILASKTVFHGQWNGRDYPYRGPTMGLRLIAGRNFHADEIVNRDSIGDSAARLGGVIVTQALARALAPGGKVLGRTAVLLPDGTTAPIIGVVARLQSSPAFGDSPLAVRTMLLPYRWTRPPIFYMVRAKPGRLAAAMTAAQNELYQISRQRIIMGMQTLTDARRDSYRGDRGVAMIMGVVCAILLGVTAFGIVGLTSHWVSQRRRQIGIRRALGATRGIILRHVQTENLQIAAGGCVIGDALALSANLWILRGIALARLPPVYPVIGVIAMLLLGQLAALWPALRAASVPPAVATRTV